MKQTYSALARIAEVGAARQHRGDDDGTAELMAMSDARSVAPIQILARMADVGAVRQRRGDDDGTAEIIAIRDPHFA